MVRAELGCPDAAELILHNRDLVFKVRDASALFGDVVGFEPVQQIRDGQACIADCAITGNLPHALPQRRFTASFRSADFDDSPLTCSPLTM